MKQHAVLSAIIGTVYLTMVQAETGHASACG